MVSHCCLCIFPEGEAHFKQVHFKDNFKSSVTLMSRPRWWEPGKRGHQTRVGTAKGNRVHGRPPSLINPNHPHAPQNVDSSLVSDAASARLHVMDLAAKQKGGQAAVSPATEAKGCQADRHSFRDKSSECSDKCYGVLNDIGRDTCLARTYFGV